MTRGEPTVVWRDEALLVLDKPARLPTTSPSGGDCLTARARAIDPHAPHLHPTSRLDAEVTGLVTFARTRAANRVLLEARAQGRYRRLYLGIAAASPEPPEGEWDWPISIDVRDARLRTVEPGPGTRAARTRYRVEARTAAATLLALRPRTGRTHQLRVHAAAAGAPLLGDVAYGGARRVVLPGGRVVTARRTMLHCARLELPAFAEGHPTGERKVIEAPPPEDMRRAWEALGGGALVLG